MTPNKTPYKEGVGSLLSIAVIPEAQGIGVGKALVVAFLNRAAALGLRAVDLTTDAIDNESANRFYLRMGFVQTRVFSTPEGRRMNEYEIELAPITIYSNGTR